MVTIHAHFDGRVLVPEGPVDLPRGRLLELQVSEIESGAGKEQVGGIDEENGIPFFRVSSKAGKITSADVRRAEDDL